MAFLTDRKRAVGNGSAREGTARHWSMTVSSMALLVLIPVFIFVVGPVIGATHEEVIAHFARPIVALITALTIWVSAMHFKTGVKMLIEDYVHGYAREFCIVATTCISYTLAAAGVFAILKMAL